MNNINCLLENEEGFEILADLLSIFISIFKDVCMLCVGTLGVGTVLDLTHDILAGLVTYWCSLIINTWVVGTVLDLLHDILTGLVTFWCQTCTVAWIHDILIGLVTFWCQTCTVAWIHDLFVYWVSFLTDNLLIGGIACVINYFADLIGTGSAVADALRVMLAGK